MSTVQTRDGSPNDLEIVGIVSQHRHDVQNDTLNCRLFVPLAQGYSGDVLLHARLATKDRRDVFVLIMRQGVLQTAFAVGVGLLLALAAGRVLSQILYQVSPADPFALAISTVLLAGAALLACFLPARRATRVNPMTALRTE